MTNAPDEKIIKADILRYKKNKLPATLALLGLVFNCLYFMLLYAMKVALNADGTFTKFCSIEMGISVILTLISLLAGFLSSEGIKGYNKKFCIVLIVLAAFQIFRIFGYPVYGLKNDYLKVNYFGYVPETSTLEFVLMLVYLIASAACFVASAVLGFVRCKQLDAHVKEVEAGNLDMDAILKQMDEKATAEGEVK